MELRGGVSGGLRRTWPVVLAVAALLAGCTAEEVMRAGGGTRRLAKEDWGGPDLFVFMIGGQSKCYSTTSDMSLGFSFDANLIFGSYYSDGGDYYKLMFGPLPEFRFGANIAFGGGPVRPFVRPGIMFGLYIAEHEPPSGDSESEWTFGIGHFGTAGVEFDLGRSGKGKLTLEYSFASSAAKYPGGKEINAGGSQFVVTLGGRL